MMMREEFVQKFTRFHFSERAEIWNPLTNFYHMTKIVSEIIFSCLNKLFLPNFRSTGVKTVNPGVNLGPTCVKAVISGANFRPNCVKVVEMLVL